MSVNGKALEHDLRSTAARWPLASAAKVDRYVKDRVAAGAAVQSRKVAAGANAELGNRAMRRFVELLYDESDGGRLVNLGDGGRVLLPAPWSRTRHRAYGLSDHTRRVLRVVLVAKLDALPPKYRLLTCEAQSWYVNLDSFGTLPAALGWLRKHTVTADDWLRANDALPRRGRNARR